MRMIDDDYLEEMRQNARVFMMLKMKGKRYVVRVWNKGWNWWCGSHGKNELCEKVVKIKRVSDIIMAVALDFEYDMQTLVCG